jgi:L-lysine 2,3-aminomutase
MDGKRALRCHTSSKSVSRRCEREKESVALHINLNAASLFERPANKSPMCIHYRRIPARTELLQQPRRLRHIREDERHSPTGQLPHKTRIARQRQPR